MIQLYKKIKEELAEQKDIRDSLRKLCDAINDPEKKEQLQLAFDEDPQVLAECLFHEQPKARRNAAAILGKLAGKDNARLIWGAYNRETQLYVKAGYLKALRAFNCEPYLDALKARQQEIQDILITGYQTGLGNPKGDGGVPEPLESNEKHFRDELKELRKILLKYEKPAYHSFVSDPPPVDVLLLTNRGCERMLAAQIPTGRIRLLNGGVQVERGDLKSLLKVRIYRELLFCLKGSRRINREDIVAEFLKSGWEEILHSLLEGEPPYYFRIDVKSPMSLEERSNFCKNLGIQLEQATAGILKNAPSAYEMELRLTENKDGSFFPLLKLRALPDKRFSYRKYTVAASIAPVQAAICMELASPWLREQARVLDPFCGVGTMLLERNYRLHADTLYGVDVYAPAIEGARENFQIAGVPGHFINRDSRTFTHEYRFDEIVTNFPTKGKNLDAHALDSLYGRFLDKALELLEEDGTIFLYSHDRGYVKKNLRSRPGWELIREWCVSEKEGAWLFCIRRAK